MTTVLALACAAASIYMLWNLLTLPFARGRRARKLTKAGAGLVAFIASVIFFSVSLEMDAEKAGFESAGEQSLAKKAGITDPAVWAQRRDEILKQQRAEEAARLAVDAEKKRAEEQAAVERKAAEEEAAAALRAERERRVKEEEEAAQAAKQAAELAEKEKCKQDLRCWGDDAQINVGFYCTRIIERMAKFDFEWTDGTFEMKFGYYRWLDRDAGTITMIGDKVKMQNGFGAWSHMLYECDVDPVNEAVLDVRVMNR